MPTRPPSLKPKPARPVSNWTKRESRQARGYGVEHTRMRKLVLEEEPLCRACLALVPPLYTPTAIADHIKPKAEGGSDERSNYQGLCRPCSDAKTLEEAARARGVSPPRRKVQIGADGWPVE